MCRHECELVVPFSPILRLVVLPLVNLLQVEKVGAAAVLFLSREPLIYQYYRQVKLK